jgi:hypothetical protein
LLEAGYYRGPETFLGTFTFLKPYPGGRLVFAESLDPAYDFPERVNFLGLDALSQDRPSGSIEDGRTKLSWNRFTRVTDVPALNWSGEVVGLLADALQETRSSAEGRASRFQVEVVGPGQLRPTTHDVALIFVTSGADSHRVDNA